MVNIDGRIIKAELFVLISSFLFCSCNLDHEKFNNSNKIDSIDRFDTIVVKEEHKSYSIDNYINTIYSKVDWLSDDVQPDDTILVLDSINYYVEDVRRNLLKISDRNKKDAVTNSLMLLELSDKKFKELSLFDRDIYYYSQNFAHTASSSSFSLYYARLLERYLFLKELSKQIEDNYELD